MRSRAILLTVSLLAGMATVGPEPVAAATPEERPDIIVILIDDMPGIDDRVLRRLPNIRTTFLEQGIRFTEFHGETPLCCPGRAGFLTGQHTHHHGVVKNTVRRFDPRMTIATQLDGVGYHTFHVGKYFNLYEAIAPSVPPGWDRFHALAPGKTGYAGYYEYDFWNHDKATPEHRGTLASDYSTDVIRGKTMFRLRQAPADRPLFAWISPYAPHSPTLPAPRHRTDTRCSSVPGWAPPHYNERDVSDKPAYVRNARPLSAPAYDLRGVCRSLLAVDEMVGAIRLELAAQARLGDTMLILTSDNGLNLGAHRLDRKSTPYSTRIPFMVSWPDRLGTQGRTIAEPLSNIDLAPTLCKIAGCKMGPYPDGQTRADGVSFAGLLFGEIPSLRRKEILQSSPLGHKPLDMPAWYGLRTTPSSGTAQKACDDAASGGCRWQYVLYETGEEELYDLSDGPCWTWTVGQPGDPCALDDRAGDQAFEEIRSTLSGRLAKRLHEP